MTHDISPDPQVDALLAELGAHLEGTAPPGTQELSAHALNAARHAVLVWPLLAASGLGAASVMALFIHLRSLEEMLILHAL
jgi:hypothetical protein